MQLIVDRRSLALAPNKQTTWVAPRWSIDASVAPLGCHNFVKNNQVVGEDIILIDSVIPYSPLLEFTITPSFIFHESSDYRGFNGLMIWFENRPLYGTLLNDFNILDIDFLYYIPKI